MSAMPPVKLPPSLRARVLEDAKPHARPGANALAPAVVLGASALWVTAFTLAHGRRDNWAELSPSASWGPLVELAFAAALAALVAISRGAVMVGPKVSRALLVIALPALAAATMPFLVPDLRPTRPGAALGAALACDAGVTIVALPILALLLLGQRGRVLTSPGLVGAVAGVAAATWGHAILHWGCPWTDFGHVLWGHVVPAIPLAIAGALVATRLHRVQLPRKDRVG
jgi:hypothetical protein